MSHPLPLRKGIIEEAKRQPGSAFQLLPFGLKTLQPIVATHVPRRFGSLYCRSSTSWLTSALFILVTSPPGPLYQPLVPPVLQCLAARRAVQPKHSFIWPTHAIHPSCRAEFPFTVDVQPAQNTRDHCVPRVSYCHNGGSNGCRDGSRTKVDRVERGYGAAAI